MAGQGRKPKTDAIRRGNKPRADVLSATVVILGGMTPPPNVEENATMLQCWEWTVSNGRYSQADVPMLTLLCEWWSIAEQCRTNLMSPGSGVITKVDTPMGARQDPDVKTLQLATNQIRQLSSELGVGPLSRSRMNLMDATTASVAADVPAKIFKMIDAARGQ